MRFIITENLHQQRIPLSGLEPLVKAQKRGWLEEHAADLFDATGQLLKSHCLLGFSFLKGRLDELIDLPPGSDILGSIGYSLLMHGSVLFFVEPSLRLKIFLILSVLCRQIGHDRLSAHPISLADDFEGSRLWVEPTKLFVQALPLNQQSWFC